MKRLRLLILVFILALAVPLGYLVVRTHRGLEEEEKAELRFFANTLFDQMEQDLANLLQREERRPVEEYFPSSTGAAGDRDATLHSPLSQGPAEPYILGYLQNGPDGSFSTPMAEGSDAGAGAGVIQEDRLAVMAHLQDANRIFNTRRAVQSETWDRQAVRTMEKETRKELTDQAQREENVAPRKAEKPSLEEKYFDVSRSSRQKAYLGQAEKRVEQISPQQALNLAPKGQEQQAAGGRAGTASLAQSRTAKGGKGDELDKAVTSTPTTTIPATQATAVPETSRIAASRSTPSTTPTPSVASTPSAPSAPSASPPPAHPMPPMPSVPPTSSAQAAGSPAHPPSTSSPAALPLEAKDGLRVEVDPLQSVPIDNGQILLFRRIVIGNQVYRQGLVILVGKLLEQLKNTHFTGQPMARFTNLSLTALNGERETARVQDGPPVAHPHFTLDRVFPRPFSFLRATLMCEDIPRSPGRDTLHVMVAVLAGVILLGFLAIYHTTRVVTDLSERRSSFVSSVTHEIKTPLTNIRMYIEMLEHGIAANPEREMEYYRILGSESARLSRLINNVLEFAKLEKRQRQLDLREGLLDEVFVEVRDAMHERLRQEGFTLTVENLLDRPVRYDREVMVQVLTNLIDNSVKFGKGLPGREISVLARPEGNRAVIRVSDTGPGIPRHALKKVFYDFYRVENELTRATKGTGIGLALVKRFVESMGGRVLAANNEGPGCTITLSLPVGHRDKAAELKSPLPQG